MSKVEIHEGVEYKVVLSVTLGSMGDIVNQVEKVLDSINSDYLSILKLTGAEPDEYRDYGFVRVLCHLRKSELGRHK